MLANRYQAINPLTMTIVNPMKRITSPT